MVKKLYLFKLLSKYNQNKPPLHTNLDDGIFISENNTILGLDRSNWKDHKIKNFRNEYIIKPFEVRQNKFDQLLLSLDKFNADLIKISFTNDLFDDEHADLLSLIRSKDIDGLIKFVNEQRYEFGNDIEEITFKDKQKRIHENISFSRNAVLTAEIEENKLEDIISSRPIGLLAGTYFPFTEEKNGEV
ncbi:hypothetical protein [Bacillus massiliigorillae]|uniref:hypothetical protein n=1 Tax=Bacillus massiliigorillae TaxID=1243664 RepID=UPI00039E6F9C|nr:hypothetical protein [Bacillus massiliigorillae]